MSQRPAHPAVRQVDINPADFDLAWAWLTGQGLRPLEDFVISRVPGPDRDFSPPSIRFHFSEAAAAMGALFKLRWN
jgi:hypothetical protein